MKILIDPGHGLNTPGKRSPDGRVLEAQFNREISRHIVNVSIPDISSFADTHASAVRKMKKFRYDDGQILHRMAFVSPCITSREDVLNFLRREHIRNCEVS